MSEITTALNEKHRYNAITRYVHEARYRKVLNYLRSLQQSLGRPPVVMDIGCGAGRIYDLLKGYMDLSYTGIELNTVRVDEGNARLKDDPNASIHEIDARDPKIFDICEPDIIMALESFEHIPEASVVRIIENIAKNTTAQKMICSVPVEIGPAIWIKNIGSALIGYKRHTEYSWGETFWSGLYQLHKVPRHEDRHKGFDWRWLAQTIRHNMKITAIHTSPYDFVPAFLSPTIMFVAEPDETAMIRHESNDDKKKLAA